MQVTRGSKECRLLEEHLLIRRLCHTYLTYQDPQNQDLNNQYLKNQDLKNNVHEDDCYWHMKFNCRAIQVFLFVHYTISQCVVWSKYMHSFSGLGLGLGLSLGGYKPALVNLQCKFTRIKWFKDLWMRLEMNAGISVRHMYMYQMMGDNRHMYMYQMMGDNHSSPINSAL